MPLIKKNTSPQARRFSVLGNLFVVLSLSLSIFDKDISQHYANLYHFSRGLFIGIGFVFLIHALRLYRRSQSCKPPQNPA